MRKHRGEARKQRRKGRIGPQAQQPLFEGLEPRLLLDGAPQGVTIPDVVPGNVFFEMTDHDNGTSYTANVAGTYTRTTPGGDWTGPDGGVLTATAAPGQWTANEDTWGVFAIKYLKKGAPIVANGNTIGMDDDSSGLADVYYQWLSYVSDTGLVGMFYRGWDREVTIKADGSFAVLTEGVQFDLWAVDASLLKRWTTDGSPPSTDHEGPGYETGRRDTESTYEDWVDSGDGAKVHLLRATSEYFRFSGRLVAPGGYFEGGTVAYWDIDAKGAPAWNATWGGNEIFTDPDGQKADLWTDVELVQDDKGWLAKSNDDGGAYVAPEVQPAAIGDFVWEDTDADGIQDGGEAGIENVTVNLYDSGDNLVASQLTAADGSYLFDNLTPGDYYLEFIPLVGYAFTVQDAGGDDALDSDANPATGQTAVTTLDSGETDLTWDAGLIAPQPGIDIEKATNGEDADNPTGPVLPVGSTATLTYVVANTGNVPLAGVVATDDNGTPGDTSDDFNPTFTGGDTDGDNLLDLTETWTYTASTTVVAGQYTNVSDVVGNPVEEDGTDIPGLPDQTDTDPSNHFGAVAGIDIEKATNGEDADSPTGPVLAVGSTATFTYVLTNTGNVPLAGVVATDDNGTPGDTSDDFNPTFTGGDTDGDALLDLTEMWTYTASTTVVAGQYTNVSDVVGNPVEEDGTDIPGLPDQTDTDPSNHFGAVAGIDIEKATNGEDADSPTGPVLAVGSTATFTYVVTNTGNVPLAGVVATDDNGTPGNTADDFNPTFVGGDTDNDGLLDLTETWTYTASATVVAGQYTNISDVVGNPVEEDGTDIPGLPDQTDEDPSNHFGEEPSEPGIGLVKSANINFVSPFDPVTYTYTVANTGSISLANVVIFDDNGTPDFAGDDFSPTFVGGDANNDGLLDPTEMWIYSETVILPLIMCQPVDGVPTQAGTMIVDILPNGDVKATFITSMAVNDNTYGLNTGADWDRVHKFTNLVGSDHARFGFTNGDGNVVFDAKVDYISETGTALYPSGFGTFGVDGKEGVINTGSLSDVVGFSTSLSDNLNQSPAYYGFTVDSPVLPDANWEVRMIYSLTLTGATFGASGLGEVRIISVHNSPDKEFNVEDPDPCDQCVTNTAVVTATANGVELSATDDETVCVGDAQPLGSIGDYVWQDNNADGIQNDGDTGIGGVGVTLAGGGADGVLGTADDTTAVTSTAADGSYLFDNLPANDYKVTFDEPAGLAFTLKDQGADDAVDSDADPINGMTDVIALATGQQIRTVDAGLTATGPVIYVCATGEKPAVLVMTYTGDSVENHSQDPRKVTITGDANDEPTVRIIASNKKKLFDRKAKVWFDGTVNLGENFAIDAANANQDKVGAETYVYIIDGQGDLIETIRFHTSCSQPLALGDDFGSITLAGFVGDGGTQLGVQQAAPAPAGIPAPTPEGDADVWAGDLEANRNKVNIELTNNGERDAVISRMLLNWASGSKNLKKVKLDGITIFKKKTAWSADGLLIETDEWAVNEDLRTIGAGATVTLTLEFEREASDIEDDYGMAIDFGDGLTALV